MHILSLQNLLVNFLNDGCFPFVGNLWIPDSLTCLPSWFIASESTSCCRSSCTDQPNLPVFCKQSGWVLEWLTDLAAFNKWETIPRWRAFLDLMNSVHLVTWNLVLLMFKCTTWVSALHFNPILKTYFKWKKSIRFIGSRFTKESCTR